MGSEDGYTPGVGTMIGTKLASVEAGNSARAGELQSMRADLRNMLSGALFAKAFAEASAEVLAEILKEFEAKDRGASTERRLSDPANRDARNQEYVTRAASNVRRLSDGKMNLPHSEQERIKALRPIN